MFDTLFHELPWQQESNVYDGKPYVQPRMTTWFGDLPYRYSGITQARNSNVSPFNVLATPSLSMLLMANAAVNYLRNRNTLRESLHLE